MATTYDYLTGSWLTEAERTQLYPTGSFDFVAPDSRGYLARYVYRDGLLHSINGQLVCRNCEGTGHKAEHCDWWGRAAELERLTYGTFPHNALGLDNVEATDGGGWNVQGAPSHSDSSHASRGSISSQASHHTSQTSQTSYSPRPSHAIPIRNPQTGAITQTASGVGPAAKPAERKILPPSMTDQNAFPALALPPPKPVQSRVKENKKNTIAAPADPSAAWTGSTLVASTSLPEVSTSMVQPNTNIVPVKKEEVSKKVVETGRRELEYIQKTSLDYYAPRFVQGWLQNPAPVRYHRTEPPAGHFPPKDYADQYIAKAYRQPEVLDDIHPALLAQDPHKGDVAPLDDDRAATGPRHYVENFSALLNLNLSFDQDFYSKVVIYEAPLSLTGTKEPVYVMELPTVREDHPRLAEGDTIYLRGVNHQRQFVTAWQIEARIVGIQKARGLVYVRSEHVTQALGDIPIWKQVPAKDAPPVNQWCFQVRFMASAAYAITQQDSVRRSAKAMLREDAAMQRWLFPEPEHVEQYASPVAEPKPLGPKHDDEGALAGLGVGLGIEEEEKEKEVVKIEDMEWKDVGLNDEQKTAITGLVNCHHPIPYLISGPPGTGKTRTLAEAAVQILRQDTCHNILVCAPSNTAADTIARRLLAQLDDRSVMFRLNNHNRSPAEVRVELHKVCHFDETGTRFDMPPYEELMKFRVVVCSLQDANLLRFAFADNTTIMHNRFNAVRVFSPRQDTSELEVLPHWTHLIIDEAAQASEPEVLIPLSVINPYRHDTPFHTWDPTIVLCGDQQQLGPNIASPQARKGDLDVSLFERLYMRDVYFNVRASHPLAWEKTAATKPFTALIRNYRSHDQILTYTSSTFYEERLLPMATNLEAFKWSKLRAANHPVAFIHRGGVESWVDEGSSWYNEGEIKCVVELIQSLLSENPGLHARDIAVITGWREQVWRMRAKLREVGLGQVDVGNVEAYQGAEFRVTIVSTVRSQKKFVQRDITNAQGFIQQPRRMNVATSRARELLVVVGNMELLHHDPNWNSFLRIGMLCDVYEGPALKDIDPTDGVVPFINQVARRQGRIKTRPDILDYEYQASAMASLVLHDPDDVPMSRSSSLSSSKSRGSARASVSPQTAPLPTFESWTSLGDDAGASTSMVRSGSGERPALPRMPEHKDW